LGVVVVGPVYGAQQQPVTQRSRSTLERVAFAVELCCWRDVPDDLHRRRIPDDGRAVPEIEQVGLGGADEGHVPGIELPLVQAVQREADRLARNELAISPQGVAGHGGRLGVTDEELAVVGLDEGAAAAELAGLRLIDLGDVERVEQAQVASGTDVVVDLVHDRVDRPCVVAGSSRALFASAATSGRQGAREDGYCAYFRLHLHFLCSCWVS
jgi:hypothetical protein